MKTPSRSSRSLDESLQWYLARALDCAARPARILVKWLAGGLAPGPLHVVERDLLGTAAGDGCREIAVVLRGILGDEATGPEGDELDEGDHDGDDIEQVEVVFGGGEVPSVAPGQLDGTEDATDL